MNPLCLEEGVGLIPWSPLAGGVLAGNREAGTVRSKSNMGLGRDRYNRPADHAVTDALKKVAGQRGESAAQVAIAWLLSKPAVTAPIVGASKAEHLDAPLAAVENPLTADEIAILEAPYESQSVVGALGPHEYPPREIRAASVPRVAA
jgi:aryl-alcohol dehydrogenase-like predicted oxidoreductase